ncbi:MAG: DUF4358 domain-containing protein [Clostridiales bacterium]|nr:DUF4358 domain-containing protein [Clostridiales bacterium]
MKKILLMFTAAILIFATSCAKSSQVADVPVDDLASVVIDSIEFPPQFQEITDSERISDEFEIFMDNVEEATVWQSPISVHLYEMIIIKSKKDKVHENKESLDNRLDKLQNQLAFYPEQVNIAGEAVVGQKGDYLYLISHEDASKGKEALILALQ